MTDGALRKQSSERGIVDDIVKRLNKLVNLSKSRSLGNSRGIITDGLQSILGLIKDGDGPRGILNVVKDLIKKLVEKINGGPLDEESKKIINDLLKELLEMVKSRQIDGNSARGLDLFDKLHRLIKWVF